MRLHNIPPIHPVHNHLHCFGHVINLLVKEFLWYENIASVGSQEEDVHNLSLGDEVQQLKE